MEMIDDTVDEIMDSLERLRRFTVDFRQRHREWAKDQPQVKRCERHQRDRPIDWDRSCRESMSARDFTLVFELCPACLREEEVLRESGWLHERGVPKKLCHARFKNFDPRDPSSKSALETAEKFSRRKEGFLILAGDIGTGKSHLAVAIMREKKTGLFIRHSSLLERIRETYRDRTAPDPVAACKRTKLLVLDDLGTSGGGTDDQPALHSILDHRHAEGLPTVITGNVTAAEIAELLGQRVFDRIRESLFKMVVVTGPSRRGEVPYAD
jgi:DNA replication protein DnaC